MNKSHHSISAVDILSSKMNHMKNSGNMNTHHEEDEYDENVMTIESESSSSESELEMEIEDGEIYQPPIINSDKDWIINHLFNYFNVIMEYLFYKVNLRYIEVLLDKRCKVQNKNHIISEYVENHTILKKLAQNDIGDYMDSLKNLIIDTLFFIENANIKRLAYKIASASQGVMLQHYPPGFPDPVTIKEDFDIQSMITGNCIYRRGEVLDKSKVIHIYDIKTCEYIGSVGDANERTIVDYINRFIHIRVIIETICRHFMSKMDISIKKNRRDRNLKNFLSSQVDSVLDQTAIIELHDNYDELYYIGGMFDCMVVTRLDKNTNVEVDIISSISEMFLRIYETIMMKLSPSQNITYALFKSHLKHLNIKKVNE